MGLLRQFEGMQLPAASELDWLVPEHDAPQKVAQLFLLFAESSSAVLFCPIKCRRTTATRRTHPLHSAPLWPPLAAAHPGLAAHLSWWWRACRHLQAEDTGAWQPGVGAATAADHLQRASCTQVSSALMAGVQFNALCTWRLAILLFTFKNLSTAGYCHCLTSNVYLNYSLTSSFLLLLCYTLYTFYELIADDWLHSWESEFLLGWVKYLSISISLSSYQSLISISSCLSL